MRREGEIGAAEVATEGSIATEVALGCFYFYSFLYFETGPVLLFGVFGIRGWHGDDSVVEVEFQCEDVVGCIGYPAVAHSLLLCGAGIGCLVSRADCEDGRVVDADCKER